MKLVYPDESISRTISPEIFIIASRVMEVLPVLLYLLQTLGTRKKTVYVFLKSMASTLL
jgi:hypothetical protein